MLVSVRRANLVRHSPVLGLSLNAKEFADDAITRLAARADIAIYNSNKILPRQCGALGGCLR